MTSDVPSRALLHSLDEALDMLRDYRDDRGIPASLAEPLPSLLKQCEAACAAFERPEPLRMIHHFACSGGTLMSKALFALPNVVVLSEIDPLSEIMLVPNGAVPFAPTDLIFALRHSARPVPDETIIETFQAGLAAAKAGLARGGRHLVLRDHAHSHFCRDAVDFDARPTLHQIVAERLDVLGLVTMRHPLDSFLSLINNGWVHFAPANLDEYCRRYLAFLDRHQGLPVVLYEDFTADPNAALKQMCAHLALTYSPLATDLIGAIRLSGDSGRSEAQIGHRPRRTVPAEIDAMRGTSATYQALCARFGYAP